MMGLSDRRIDMQPAAVSLRAQLYRLTCDAHAQSEQFWAPSGVLETRWHYNMFLRQLHKAHCTLGLPAAHALADADAIQEETYRIAGLAVDLNGHVDHGPTHAKLGMSEAWGVAYVLNGSSLGAAMMLKSRSIPEDWPADYMSRSAAFAKSGRLKAFFDGLNSAEIDILKTAAGAKRCFDIFVNSTVFKQDQPIGNVAQ